MQWKLSFFFLVWKMLHIQVYIHSYTLAMRILLAIVPIPLLVILTDMFVEVIQVRYFARSVQFAEVYILCQREWIDTILRIFVAEKHWKTIL